MWYSRTPQSTPFCVRLAYKSYRTRRRIERQVAAVDRQPLRADGPVARSVPWVHETEVRLLVGPLAVSEDW